MQGGRVTVRDLAMCRWHYYEEVKLITDRFRLALCGHTTHRISISFSLSGQQKAYAVRLVFTRFSLTEGQNQAAFTIKGRKVVIDHMRVRFAQKSTSGRKFRNDGVKIQKCRGGGKFIE